MKVEIDKYQEYKTSTDTKMNVTILKLEARGTEKEIDVLMKKISELFNKK